MFDSEKALEYDRLHYNYLAKGAVLKACEQIPAVVGLEDEIVNTKVPFIEGVTVLVLFKGNISHYMYPKY